MMFTVAHIRALEQVIILGQGAQRMSADGLKEEIELMQNEIRSEYLNKPENARNYLFDHMSEELVNEMENVRLGKKRRDY